jgi:hypothetical protein
MPARFKAQAGADPVEALKEIGATFDHAGAAQQRRPARHKADGVTGCVAIDTKEMMAHYGDFQAAFQAATAGFSVGRVAAHCSTQAMTSARR